MAVSPQNSPLTGAYLLRHGVQEDEAWGLGGFQMRRSKSWWFTEIVRFGLCAGLVALMWMGLVVQ